MSNKQSGGTRGKAGDGGNAKSPNTDWLYVNGFRKSYRGYEARIKGGIIYIENGKLYIDRDYIHKKELLGNATKADIEKYIGKGKDVNEYNLALAEYSDYTHGGGIIDEKSGAYKHMNILFEKNKLKADKTLYRGGTQVELDVLMKQAGVKTSQELVDKVIQNRQYRSSADNETYPRDYAHDAFEYYAEESGSNNVLDIYNSIPRSERPVFFEYHAKKGAKVIKRTQFTDDVGRGATREWTVGHGTKFKVRKVVTERMNMWGGQWYPIKKLIIDVY